MCPLFASTQTLSLTLMLSLLLHGHHVLSNLAKSLSNLQLFHTVIRLHAPSLQSGTNSYEMLHLQHTKKTIKAVFNKNDKNKSQTYQWITKKQKAKTLFSFSFSYNEHGTKLVKKLKDSSGMICPPVIITANVAISNSSWWCKSQCCLILQYFKEMVIRHRTVGSRRPQPPLRHQRDHLWMTTLLEIVYN